MRIDRLEIKNFRKFGDMSLEFNPSFNLLVGDNGSGKTTVLDALAVALAGWTYAFAPSQSNRRLIQDQEVRIVEKNKRFNSIYPSKVEATGLADIIIDGVISTETIRWWRIKDAKRSTLGSVFVKHGAKKTKAGELIDLENRFHFTKLGESILQNFVTEDNFNFPLIAFYKCDRLWLPPSSPPSIENAAKVQYSHFTPYEDCFHTSFNTTALKEWLLKQELIRLQKKKATFALNLVTKALLNCVEGCKGISFDMEESSVIVEFKDGARIPYDCLSDGQRTMFAMVSDLVFRACILNPHLEGSTLAEITGVVLIDELDLHLHPKWQRRVIEDLRRIFPKVQFICTTHSPFLIQTLRSSDELIMLEGSPTDELNNLGIEAIAAGIMGVPDTEASPRYMAMLNDARAYLAELDEAAKAPKDRLAEYERQLAAHIAPYPDNPAFQAVLEAEKKYKFGN